MVWLSVSDGEKSLSGCDVVLIEYTTVTDRQTDSQSD